MSKTTTVYQLWWWNEDHGGTLRRQSFDLEKLIEHGRKEVHRDWQDEMGEWTKDQGPPPSKNYPNDCHAMWTFEMTNPWSACYYVTETVIYD